MAPRFLASYFQTWFLVQNRSLPARFGVVTAQNPMDRKLPAAENRRRDARLRRTLKALGLPHFRVTGGSRDGSHRERGWGVVTKSPTLIRALAALFEQNAYFWISQDRILLGSSTGAKLHGAGTWSARQARWPTRRA